MPIFSYTLYNFVSSSTMRYLRNRGFGARGAVYGIFALTVADRRKGLLRTRDQGSAGDNVVLLYLELCLDYYLP